MPGSYRFFVLDQPVANAHALSSGYVFVTRGLLALMDDEAELAAAMAHELGHLTERHAAQRERERRVVMDAAVDAAMKSGSVTVGRSVARDGLMRLRRYSRDQELEADRVGVGYITRAGYRGDAMITLIEKLRRQSSLEDQAHGPARGRPRPERAVDPSGGRRSSGGAARHGRRSARRARTAGRAISRRSTACRSTIRPRKASCAGRPSCIPTMRIAFSALRDFKLYNDHEGVLGVGSDRSLLYFTCKAGSVPGKLDDWMRNKLQPTPTDIQSTEIGGAEAAIGARPRGSDTGLNQVRYVIIRRPDGICYFNLAERRGRPRPADRRHGRGGAQLP